VRATSWSSSHGRWHHYCGRKEWTARKCTYCLSEAHDGHGVSCEGPLCGDTAIAHVVFSVSPWATGYICAEHAPALLHIEHYQWHTVDVACGMPVCPWDFEENSCFEWECDCRTCACNRTLAERHEPAPEILLPTAVSPRELRP